ncbi:hypothetical protein [Agromyces binzhouensis]|uniref:Uncharacterized protein n=1 Tax=Agromyces binzhouensis TaxID=1817495 RepID=A0A4Q2JZE5_9MICO|nr:hypothetical protein [Agromyces binzhouensis]RXZ51648.1 hypothetical protein ESO86_01540 [Agromyces binzhouensis]
MSDTDRSAEMPERPDGYEDARERTEDPDEVRDGSTSETGDAQPMSESTDGGLDGGDPGVEE